MKNRPLCSICLIVFLIICTCVWTGGNRYLLRRVPPGLEKQDGKEVSLTGQVYQIEIKKSYQVLYFKHSNNKSRFLIYDDKKQSIQIGNTIKVKGRILLFEEAENPGNFDQKFYYAKQGIIAAIWAEHVSIEDNRVSFLKQKLYELRCNWNEALLESMGEKDAGVLSAILLGEKSGMDRQVKELYQVNGIAHVLAISGLHLSIIGVGMYKLLRRFTGSYLVGGTAGICFLLCYISMVGMTVSAVRALTMFLFRVGADMAGRKFETKR